VPVERRPSISEFGAADIKAANLRSTGISGADVHWAMMAAVRMAGVCEGGMLDRSILRDGIQVAVAPSTAASSAIRISLMSAIPFGKFL
jgi:hypothetical protein